MPSVAQIAAAGRELLAREPAISDAALRAYLLREFAVERDREVTLVRSGLWPLALVARLFRGSAARQTACIRKRVDVALQQLRNEQAPPTDNC